MKRFCGRKALKITSYSLCAHLSNTQYANRFTQTSIFQNVCQFDIFVWRHMYIQTPISV